MALKYSYKIGNVITETLEKKSIPAGVEFNQIEYEDNQALAIDPVTPRQMRVALIMSGISIESIDAVISVLEEPQQSIVKTTWEYTTIFERENEMLNQMAPLLNLTQAQIDDLFLLAKTL